MHPGLDSPQGNAHRLGNFPVTQFLFMKQNKRLAIILANSRQSQRHLFGQVLGSLNIRQAVGNLFRQHFRGGTALARGKRRPAAVAGNCQQPRFKIAGRIPTVQVLQHPHKSLLGHILGVLPLPKHAVAQPEDLTSKAFHQGQHRPLVASQATSDESPQVVSQVDGRLGVVQRKYPSFGRLVSAR